MVSRVIYEHMQAPPKVLHRHGGSSAKHKAFVPARGAVQVWHTHMSSHYIIMQDLRRKCCADFISPKKKAVGWL